MAGIATHGGVRPGQRKAVVVLLNLLYGNLPSTHRVALFAIRAELALVNIGMAILASLPDVRKHGLHVTLRTRHGLVHAAQRIFRLIVIEFGDGANRLPCAGGMTVLARNV